MGLSVSRAHRHHSILGDILVMCGSFCAAGTARGELALAALVVAPRACMRWVWRDPNHDAAMRIGGEAPGRRAHSAPRLAGHAYARVTATSDRHRPLATRPWMSAESPCS